MRAATIVSTLTYLGAMALCPVRAQETRVLDRTSEPVPIIVESSLDLSDVTLIDNNPSRPAIIVLNGELKLHAGNRDRRPVFASSGDPGLGKWFDGKKLPTLEIGFSHHDFARSFIVGLGKVKIEVGTLNADSGVLLVANPDGGYGRDSSVKIESIIGHRFGVLASGQEKLAVTIDNSVAALWPFHGAEPPGHTFYANESRIKGRYLRCKDIKVRIGKSRVVTMAKNVRADHVTAKFKGAWGVDYECLDDENPCGALDQYDSSGKAKVVWRFPGGEAWNPIFAAFRSGGGGHFGSPKGRFVISGEFDCALHPGQGVPPYRLETANSKFERATLFGTRGAEWEGTDSSGLSIVSKRT